MTNTLSTLIYAAPRSDVEEMIKIRKMLTGLMGKSFVENADRNEGSCVNKVVCQFDQLFKIVENINLRMPEEGEKVNKLVDIAKEKNIDYKPS
jgi:hypothetical protein